MRREKTFVSVFLVLICLVMAQAVHNGWYLYLQYIGSQSPAPGTQIVYAPEGYRVAIPFLRGIFTKITHVQDTATILAVFDFVSGFFACYLFYRLAVNFLPEDDGTGSKRLLVIALFLAMIQFPMAWVVSWQRPETLPASLYLSVVFLLFVKVERRLWWFSSILVVTAIQGFFRTDVPFFLGAAIVLLSILPGASIASGLRRSLFFLGCLVAFVAASVQVSLQYVFLPHLPRREGVPVFTLGLNMRIPHFFVIFLISCLPFLIFAAFLVIKRPRLQLVDRLILIAAAVYLAVWFTVGIISEVRLFVPYMLALSTVAAKVLASSLTLSEPAIEPVVLRNSSKVV